MIKTICKGNRSNKIHFGMPKLASIFEYINKFAGKTATNTMIIPKAAYPLNIGMHKRTPKIISVKPLILFSNLGFGK